MNYIFVGVPRTGSSSISETIKGGEVLNHLSRLGRNFTARDIKEFVGIEWDSAYKFAFTRHPIDRAMSAYKTLLGYYGKITLGEAMKKNPKIFIPQVDFINEKLDFIGRYEKLEEDWKKVAKKIGVSEKLPHVNKNNFEGIAEFSLDEYVFLKELYKEDFKKFGYEL